MTITDSAKLAAAIQVSSLLRVCIPASGIDDDRCKILCHSLIINKTVTFLDLSHNKITSEGARSVARLLAEANGQLKNLILTNNQLGPNAGMCLGKAMALNKSLKSINLRLNRLGEEGGINLLSQLKNNHTLTEIDLSGTSLVSQCIPALATLLKCNDSTLVSLDLSCNKLGNFVAPSSTEFAEHQEQTASSIVVQAATASPDLAGKAILEAISLNKVLKLTQYITKFDIRMTEISPEYHIAIQGIVSENGAC